MLYKKTKNIHTNKYCTVQTIYNYESSPISSLLSKLIDTLQGVNFDKTYELNRDLKSEVSNFKNRSYN